MVFKDKIHYQASNGLLDSYLFFSFLMAIIIGGGSFLLDNSFFSKGFFVSVFIVSNYYFFTRGWGWSYVLQETIFWPGLFVVQIISLIGISYIEKTLGGLYLSLIPTTFGLYFFSHRTLMYGKEQSVKALFLLLIAVGSYVVFYGVTNRSLLNVNDTFYLTLFIFWEMSIIYFGCRHINDENNSIMGTFISSKNIKEEKDCVNEWSKDRLFFHDVINQTHGINLYLNHRVSSERNLSIDEMKLLIEEIKMIQLLIKDHYGLSHRNLFNVSEFVDFNKIKQTAMRIVENYLPPYLVECNFSFEGLAENLNDKCIVHYPSFCRIFTNLIKNVTEVKTDQVDIIFSFNKGLDLIVKNKVFYLKDDHDNLAKNLGDIILGRNYETKLRRESGLGLESISSICKEMKGHFHFSIEGEYWVNHVFLPIPVFEFNQDEEEIKKAA